MGSIRSHLTLTRLRRLRMRYECQNVKFSSLLGYHNQRHSSLTVTLTCSPLHSATL